MLGKHVEKVVTEVVMTNDVVNILRRLFCYSIFSICGEIWMIYNKLCIITFAV